MSGIYIHIPFCKRKCFYCDFYSSANLNLKIDFLKSLQNEIQLQSNYLKGDKISSVYLGGGTPSLLSKDEINSIFVELHKHFPIGQDAEITIELNPDDITLEYSENLINAGINRVSVGVQSFFDDDLKLLNRRHSSQQSFDTINILKQTGFRNISIDLIYGLPGMNIERWSQNLNKIFDLNIQHISAYHLSIEAGTVFAHFLDKGKINVSDDEKSLLQFKTLINEAKKNEFIHYEISNFGKENFFSGHNSAYWQQKKYLGLGPSAHSFNIETRQWNVSDIKSYIEKISNGIIPCDIENLTKTDKYNDYIMISLRTYSGINIQYVKDNFGSDKLIELLKISEKYVKTNHLKLSGNNISLTDEGMFISDRIISELFELN